MTHAEPPCTPMQVLALALLGLCRALQDLAAHASAEPDQLKSFWQVRVASPEPEYPNEHANVHVEPAGLLVQVAAAAFAGEVSVGHAPCESHANGVPSQVWSDWHVRLALPLATSPAVGQVKPSHLSPATLSRHGAPDALGGVKMSGQPLVTHAPAASHSLSNQNTRGTRAGVGPGVCGGVRTG